MTWYPCILKLQGMFRTLFTCPTSQSLRLVLTGRVSVTRWPTYCKAMCVCVPESELFICRRSRITAPELTDVIFSVSLLSQNKWWQTCELPAKTKLLFLQWCLNKQKTVTCKERSVDVLNLLQKILTTMWGNGHLFTRDLFLFVRNVSLL